MIKKMVTTSLALCLAVYPLLFVQAATLSPEDRGSYVPAVAGLSAEQMDNLFAPIALYPDPILAQMLPASTFVDQIDEAARYLRASSGQTSSVDNQAWDVSVRSIAHYPSVVYSMSEKLDWTTALGQAYVSQSADAFNSIQRLRKKAKDAGYLKSSPQQNVIVEGNIIKIVPAQPQVIYVPTYNPQVVYVAPPPSGPSTAAVVATGAIAFTAGLAIGAWLNNDCNWNSHSVYYHGWVGVGWVSSSATVIRVNNSVYVNARYSTVHYNAAVVNRNVNYNNVNVYNNVSRNVNYNNVNVNNVNVNNVNRNNVNVNNANVNNVNRNTANVNNAQVNNISNQNLNKNVSNTSNYNAYRGQANTASQTSAGANANRQSTQANAQQRSSAFGGGGASANATNAQSQRGQASRSSAPAAASSSRTAPTRSGASSGSSGGGGRRKN